MAISLLSTREHRVCLACVHLGHVHLRGEGAKHVLVEHPAVNESALAPPSTYVYGYSVHE